MSNINDLENEELTKYHQSKENISLENSFIPIIKKLGLWDTPSTFDNSLSWYQALKYVLKYLIDNVIPKTNDLDEFTSNLQRYYEDTTDYINLTIHNTTDYINNYFHELEIQDEINTKLDDMKNNGTLSNLISPLLDDKLSNEAQARINMDNFLNNKINNVASGSPLVANSVSDMIDTTRIYVNTTDGYWYYYNGTNWVQGDVYQATRIEQSDPYLQIINTKIGTIKYINNDISNDFTTTDGYYIKNVNGVATPDTGSAFHYQKITIDNSNVSISYSIITTVANMTAYGNYVFITDENDTILKSCIESDGTTEQKTITISAEELASIPDAKYIYVTRYGTSHPAVITKNIAIPMQLQIDNINNDIFEINKNIGDEITDTINKNISDDFTTIDGKYIKNTNGVVVPSNASAFHYQKIAIDKYANSYSIITTVANMTAYGNYVFITDENDNILHSYVESTGNTEQKSVLINSNDLIDAKYIYVTRYGTSHPAVITKNILNNIVEQLNKINNLKPSFIGKKILYMGDSITALSGQRGWTNYCNDILSTEKSVNIAVTGAKWRDQDGTIYDGNPTQEDSVNNVIGNQLEKILRGKDILNPNYSYVEDYNDFDLIIIAAGTNDTGFRIENETASESFITNNNEVIPITNVDKTKMGGAFRYVTENLRRLYPNAKILICTPIQRSSYNKKL